MVCWGDHGHYVVLEVFLHIYPVDLYTIWPRALGSAHLFRFFFETKSKKNTVIWKLVGWEFLKIHKRVGHKTLDFVPPVYMPIAGPIMENVGIKHTLTVKAI